MDRVIWHDVECGGYAADLPLWRALADETGGPVLDLGSGTGRVALDLAALGVEVHALDVDAALLDALGERAAMRPGARVVTHVDDARGFDLGRRFALVIAPMQTVQLLGGADARAAMLAAVRRHLGPGGRFAAAVAALVEGYEGDVEPLPDVREVGGVVYSSRPVAIRDDGDGFILDRVREKVTADGRLETTEDHVRLGRLTAAALEAEGRAAGLTVQPRRVVPATDDHVGSEVVVLGG